MAQEDQAGVKTYKMADVLTRYVAQLRSLFHSKRDVFLHVLISNAEDALSKIHFQSLNNPEVLAAESTLAIQLIPDKINRTLTLIDTGIGMTEMDLIQTLGTIPTNNHRAPLEICRDEEDLEGFCEAGWRGGFYSAFVVADRVEVTSKNNDDDEQHTWRSAGARSFTVTADKEEDAKLPIGRGTRIVLHLKDTETAYLEQQYLKDFVLSNYVHILHKWPISIGTEVLKHNCWWKRQPAAVTETQYGEHFRALCDYGSQYIAVKHFSIASQLEYSAVLFVPRKSRLQAAQDRRKRTRSLIRLVLYEKANDRGSPRFKFQESLPKYLDAFLLDRVDTDIMTRSSAKLYVRSQLCMEHCEHLLPKYLSFLAVLVDSEDLCLNICPEALSQSKILRVIRKQLMKHAMKLFSDLTEDDQKFKTFYEAFSAYLKLGIQEDSANRANISKLLRYPSSKCEGEKQTSLENYLSRMPKGQKYVYCDLISKGQDVLFLREKWKDLESEVLFILDPLDEAAWEALEWTFEGIKLVSLEIAEGGDIIVRSWSVAGSRRLAQRMRVVQDKQEQKAEGANMTGLGGHGHSDWPEVDRLTTR